MTADVRLTQPAPRAAEKVGTTRRVSERLAIMKTRPKDAHLLPVTRIMKT
jgi:hypothetical protein